MNSAPESVPHSPLLPKWLIYLLAAAAIAAIAGVAAYGFQTIYEHKLHKKIEQETIKKAHEDSKNADLSAKLISNEFILISKSADGCLFLAQKLTTMYDQKSNISIDAFDASIDYFQKTSNSTKDLFIKNDDIRDAKNYLDQMFVDLDKMLGCLEKKSYGSSAWYALSDDKRFSFVRAANSFMENYKLLKLKIPG